MTPTLDDLVERVDGLRTVAGRPRVLLGIAGAPGSGKSTLARALVERLGGFPNIGYVPMDGFHLADVELARLGRTDRKGAPDSFDPDGYAALLRRIAAGEPVLAPAFDRRIEQPIAQSIAVTAEAQVVVSEGNYLLLDEPHWRAVREMFDEVWFCREDEAERVQRLIARHIEFGKSPRAAREWVLRLDERNAELVATSAGDADLIVELAGLDLRGG